MKKNETDQSRRYPQVKDLSTRAAASDDDGSLTRGSGTGQPALALLLVNHGKSTLAEYSLDISKLPLYFKHGGKALEVRDIWNLKTLPGAEVNTFR